MHREQKILYILAVRGIAIYSEFGKYILSEYEKMLDDELQIEYDFYITNFNSWNSYSFF